MAETSANAAIAGGIVGSIVAMLLIILVVIVLSVVLKEKKKGELTHSLIVCTFLFTESVRLKSNGSVEMDDKFDVGFYGLSVLCYLYDSHL